VLEQRLVLGIIGRHVRLQQACARELGLDAGVGEGEALHFLAGHAPVRIEVEHRRLAGRSRRGDLALEVRDRLHTDELDVRVGRGRCRAAPQARQRLQRVAAPGERTDQQQHAIHHCERAEAAAHDGGAGARRVGTQGHQP